MSERIDVVPITEETRRRYLNYALSVITSRALPDVRDGLKPVQRRILYAMYHDLHLYSNERPLKCAKVCGDVLGNYHPHGEQAVYDALVRMAQDWVLRYPLVWGEGNFGSVDGYPPAANRYTECKLRAVAEELMVELRQKTVDMRATFDGMTEEPAVLPARFPHVLVNGVAGIAVGMATNIPPHNLGDVIKSAIHLIKNPEATTAQLLDCLKGPDFPLGGRILADRKLLRNIYETGSGTFKIQAEWKLEESGKRRQIIVTSIPYGVNKGALEEKIGILIAERKLPQMVNVVNESNEKEGLRIALELKGDANADLVMSYLYKHTALQDNFSCNFTCLTPIEGGGGKMRPERLSLNEILRYFLDFRFETVKRRFEFHLAQLQKRIHILQGFKIIFNDLDRALQLIRESKGKQDAARKLMDEFRLDEIQADAILEIMLYKIARLEIKRILEELKEKKAQAKEIEEILGSDRRLWTVVRKELEELGEKHGDRRRTKISSEEAAPEFDPEAYIVKENTNIILTRDGWIKRVGRLASLTSTRVREGDEIIAVLPGNTLDHAIFFCDNGVAYTMRMSEVPASSGYGEPISKYFRLPDGAKVVSAVSTDERFTPPDEKPQNGEPVGPYMLAATAQGQTLRLSLSPFRTASTVKGRLFVRLRKGDRVVFAQLVRDHRSIFLASAQGHVLHFPIDQINILSGVGKGVIGIKLSKNDVCIGGALIRNQNDCISVETTKGKNLELFGSRELTSRGGKGFAVVKRSKLAQVIPPEIELVNWDEM